jgi:hypothetical protein
MSPNLGRLPIDGIDFEGLFNKFPVYIQAETPRRYKVERRH